MRPNQNIGHKETSHLERYSAKNYDASKSCTCSSDSLTSATLMNGCPFKGSNNVFQLEDFVHLPCTGWMKATNQLDVAGKQEP